MSKFDKDVGIKSATELRQSPLCERGKVSKATKKKKSVIKSNHKHDYKIVSIDSSIFRNKSDGELFTKRDNEYFGIKSVCSVCGKVNSDFKRIWIDEFNEKYRDIYTELNKVKEKENENSDI